MRRLGDDFARLFEERLGARPIVKAREPRVRRKSCDGNVWNAWGSSTA